MADNGEEKLIAVARHIAKTLGHTDSMTDDILKIFSNFDGRLREKLSDDGIEQTINSLDRRLSRYISIDAPIWSNSADVASFLDSVDQLIAAVRDWTPLAAHKRVSACLDRAEDLLQQTMLRLEDEFRALLEGGGGSSRHPDYSDEDDDVSVEDDDSIPVAQPVTDYNFLIDALPAGTVGDLHEIAKRMVAAGYEKECCGVYSGCRREFLERSLSRLGLQKLSIDEVQRMQWTQLEEEIEKWIKAINVTLRVLLPSERRLCDRVFSGCLSAADVSFLEVCRGSTVELLNFADAVAISSRSPERLFKVLDVYEAVRDLMPEFELIFSGECCLSLRNEAISVWKRLGDVIRGIFLELENLIRRDPAKSAVPGGGLHPITRYVMNYLRAACRSRQTLEQVFEESVVDVDHGKVDDESACVLSVQLAWIMELLESNLEAKSKVYKDAALSSVFMMNNGRYIVQKAKDNELGALLGDDWIRKHMAKVRQYHVKYQRSSWGKALSFLKVDHSSESSNGTSKTLREKLKLFNAYFEETCKIQSSWMIFDEQLKEELKISVSGHLSPAYRNFIGRLQAFADVGKHGDRHIRYSVEDIEARITDLFRGTASGRK
ncbi:exocyst subunit exo70 family protein B1 [Perilla frutescens var. hirtella]|uniref:Exocyst subunit Exo70 family protein n=1 Tax=Perilla frutescens var. hirtella TaxID=608512 RepID=A0AAD4JP86_PERFH|nr:exocyst subunit exo70 family protein B1 [Perilla frutescens var. hirtella]